jgi:hypothetical protein
MSVGLGSIYPSCILANCSMLSGNLIQITIRWDVCVVVLDDVESWDVI